MALQAGVVAARAASNFLENWWRKKEVESAQILRWPCQVADQKEFFSQGGLTADAVNTSQKIINIIFIH